MAARTMQSNRKYVKLALLAVLFLMTALILICCANKRKEDGELIKDLVAELEQTPDTPHNNIELSEDLIISIEKPDIMGGDDENDDAESDGTTVGDGDDTPQEGGEDTSDSEGTGETESDDVTSSEAPESALPEDGETEAETEVETETDEDPSVQLPEGVYVKYDVPLSESMQIYIIDTAEKFGIPPELMFGVMHVESRYKVSAISKNGKYIGMMQIAKSNLKMLTKKFGITDLQDFEQNVTAGAYFLSYFYKKYDGDIDKVLMCYHCGEGGAKKCWRNGYYTDGYCRKVKKEMDRILASYDPTETMVKESD